MEKPGAKILQFPSPEEQLERTKERIIKAAIDYAQNWHPKEVEFTWSEKGTKNRFDLVLKFTAENVSDDIDFFHGLSEHLNKRITHPYSATVANSIDSKGNYVPHITFEKK